MLKKKLTLKPLRVVELFAGVGGFRIGLEAIKVNKKKVFEVVWSNQWEPGAKVQYASNIYAKTFGEKDHSNEDITTVDTSKIPEFDLLVGGFPCQDYSVARTLSQATGLEGKKGVLWWQIYRILKEKEKNKPKYLMLENVDRLLKSPAKQRGRDFAIMLASLSDLGYAVEWKVINAADYGFPQKRRRVFFIGYLKGTTTYKKIETSMAEEWITKQSVINNAFPGEISQKEKNCFNIDGDLAEISAKFGNPKLSLFCSQGLMINRKVFTSKHKALYDGLRITLGDIVEKDKKVDKEYYIPDRDLPKWKELKGPKKIERTNKGFTYHYSEGGMSFPDPLDRPARTIITGEGGTTPSRFKHVINTKHGMRRLLPVELERINGFPPEHTAIPGISSVKRAFLMGNALVVGVIEGLGKSLAKEVYENSK